MAYFANMFCYGSAQDIVGVTGIRGCLGIIYVGNRSMYAVHIPPDHDSVQKLGRKTFATFVKNNEQAVGKGNGRLIAFVNGTNRADVLDEMKDMKKRLNSPPTTIYRIMKHLGPESGKLGADAAAIMLERYIGTPNNPDACFIWYKKHNSITWVSGGIHEAGQYKDRSPYKGDLVPSEYNAHWWRMNDLNCTITKV